MNIKDFKVGQKVFLKKVENQARYLKNAPIEDYISEETITRVGNKYLYLDGDRYDSMKFGVGHHNIIMDISEYVANFHLYSTKQEIYDEFLHSKLHSKIEGEFQYSAPENLTVDQLQQIHVIIWGEKYDNNL